MLHATFAAKNLGSVAISPPNFNIPAIDIKLKAIGIKASKDMVGRTPTLIMYINNIWADTAKIIKAILLAFMPKRIGKWFRSTVLSASISGY